MGDIAFAKSFLTTLDNKATKYQSDYAFDPSQFQLRIPYTLPKLSHPSHPYPPKSTPSSAAAPGSAPASSTISLTLKSSRNPNMTLTLPSLDPSTTSIQSLKERIQSHLGGASVVGIDKIKILSNKKPIPPSKKTIVDALDKLPAANDTVEFGIMVMGGAPDPPPTGAATAQTDPAMASAPGSEQATAEAAPETTADDTNAAATLESSEFWSDLQGFLEQRLKSEKEASRLKTLFENAWRSSSARP